MFCYPSQYTNAKYLNAEFKKVRKKGGKTGERKSPTKPTQSAFSASLYLNAGDGHAGNVKTMEPVQAKEALVPEGGDEGVVGQGQLGQLGQAVPHVVWR